MNSINKFLSQVQFNHGKFNPDLEIYFITITIRKSKGLFSTPLEFALYLESLLVKHRYPRCITGIIEYGKSTGFHFHGLTNWKYKHFAGKDNIFAYVKPINEGSLPRVIRYITKDIDI